MIPRQDLNTVDRVQSIFNELAGREVSMGVPIDQLGLDSLVLIQGLVRIEEAFGVVTPRVDELLAAEGRTLQHLAGLVDQERVR